MTLSAPFLRRRWSLRFRSDPARFIWGGRGPFQEGGGVIKNPSLRATGAIARPRAARYSGMARERTSPNPGFKTHDEVDFSAGRCGGRPLFRDCQSCRKHHQRRTAEASAAAAEELSARPDLVAARTQWQTDRLDAQRQPQDRQRASRLRLHRLQFVVGDDVSDQGSAFARGPVRADQEAMRQGHDGDRVRLLVGAVGAAAWDLVNGDLVIKGPRGALRMVRSL